MYYCCCNTLNNKLKITVVIKDTADSFKCLLLLRKRSFKFLTVHKVCTDMDMGFGNCVSRDRTNAAGLRYTRRENKIL